MEEVRGDTDDEWICGVLNCSNWVVETGDRASLLLVLAWVRANGELISFEAIRASEYPDAAVATFHELVNGAESRPLPARVRVPFHEFAGQLRRGWPQVDVVCGETPEIEPVRAHLERGLVLERSGEKEKPPKPVLPVPSFYESAASLWEMAPWAWLPGGTVVKVSAPDFGLPYAGALFAGSRKGDDPAVLLFNSVKDAERFVELLDKYRSAPSEQLKSQMPGHLMLGYVRPKGRPPLPAEVVETARKMGWSVAHDSIFPWHAAYRPGLNPEPMTPSEVWLMEIIQFAFTAMFSRAGDPSAIGDVFASGLVLQAHGGRIGRVDVALPLDVVIMAHELGRPFSQWRSN